MPNLACVDPAPAEQPWPRVGGYELAGGTPSPGLASSGTPRAPSPGLGPLTQDDHADAASPPSDPMAVDGGATAATQPDVDMASPGHDRESEPRPSDEVPGAPGAPLAPGGSGPPSGTSTRPTPSGDAKRKRAPVPLVKHPTQRGPLNWVATVQTAKAPATCRMCCKHFTHGQVRMILAVDRKGSKSYYYHEHCIDGGFHPRDTILEETQLTLSQRTSLAALRMSQTEYDAGSGAPELPFAKLPRTVREAARVHGPEWWDTVSWSDFRKLHALTLVDVPKNCRAAYADLVVSVIAEVEDAEPAMLAGDPLPRQRAWMKLSVLDAMVLNSTRSPGESQSVALLRRVRAFQAGQWETLWQEATRPQGTRRLAEMTHEERERKVAAKVQALALAGQAKRAARAAIAKPPPITDPAREAELKTLFPAAPARTPSRGHVPPVERTLPEEWTTPQGVLLIQQMHDRVCDNIRRPNRLAQPGPMATRAEHLELLRYTEDGVTRMADLIVRLALGQEPRAVTRAHATGAVLAIAKPCGGMRPLIMHSLHRRIGLGALAHVLKGETMAASGPHQLGVGATDGCVNAYHAMSALAELHPASPIMGCDVSAAHQSLDRDWMMQETRTLCPLLERPLAVWYPRDEPTVHWWKPAGGDIVDIIAGNGLDQGCPLACPAYGVSTARPAERALQTMRAADPQAQLLLFADDTQLQIDAGSLTLAHEAVSAEWAKAGLTLNAGKTKVFTTTPDAPLGPWEPNRVATLKCLGAHLVDDGIAWEHPSQGDQDGDDLIRAAAKVEAFAARLCELQVVGLSVQLSQALLRYATVGGPQHILMCKAATQEQMRWYDAAVRGAWQRVLGLDMTDDNWERATLPLKLGGLAPGTVSNRASAAYLTALSRTMPEVLRRTDLPSAPALRAMAPRLDRSITGAVADLEERGAPKAKIPFADGTGAADAKQKDLVNHIHERRYEQRLETMDNAGRGQLRSASGSGSAAFLLMPTQQDHCIEDPLFRVAVVRRLGGWVVHRDGAGPQRYCALVGRNGVCRHPLDTGGIHVNQCKNGGYVVRRHDRVLRWLAEWIGDRVDTEVLLEQSVPTEGEGGDRLDLTLESGGRRLWIDVAIVTVKTINASETVRRARIDGQAALHEEAAKRSRYNSYATPFVVEAHGRPGDTARSIIGRFAVDRGSGISSDVSAAWQSLSAIVQSESAALELRSSGYTPATWDSVNYFV